jgi:hypothetical protein
MVVMVPLQFHDGGVVDLVVSAIVDSGGTSVEACI